MSKISELSDGGSLQSTDYLIAVRSGGNVKVQADGAVTGTTGSFSGNVTFADNAKAIFGAGSDLQIYHDGTHSRIDDAGTGKLILRGNDAVEIHKYTGEYMITAVADGAVTLYHDDSVKLATTATGIDVTGTVTADGLTVDGSSPDVIVKDTQTHTTTDGPLIQFQGKGPNGTNYNFGYIQGLSNGSNNAGDMVLGTNTAGVQYQRMRLEDNGDISFYEDTGTTPKLTWSASNESLTVPTLVISDGAITTTAAAGDHTVFNSTGADADFRVRTGANTHSLYVEGNTGNVGIGTDSPATILHAKSASPELLLQDSSQTGRQTQLTQASGIAKIRSRNNASNGQIVFEGYTASTTSEYMRLDASGNLLVGKTSADSTITGVQILPEGDVGVTRDGSHALLLNRLTSDGDIALFRKDGTTVGTIGVAGGDLFIGTGSNASVRFNDGVSALTPASGTANADNLVDLGYSTLRWKNLYLSGGVYLGGTGAANKLEDYEEGTWTPGINYGSPTGTAATLSEAGGTYTKIGRVVTVHAEIDVSNTNSGSGVIYIVGLPFTVADIISPTGLEANGVVSYFTGFSSSVNSLAVAAENNTNFLNLMGLTSSTSTAVVSITEAIMGTGEIRLSITYFTT